MRLRTYLIPSLCAALAGLAVPVSFFINRDEAFTGALIFAGLCLIGCILLAVTGIRKIGKRGLWLLLPAFVALPWPAASALIAVICAIDLTSCP